MKKSLLNNADVRVALEEYFYNKYSKESPSVEEVLSLFAEFLENEDDEEKYSESYNLVLNAVAKINEDAFREGFYSAWELFTD